MSAPVNGTNWGCSVVLNVDTDLCAPHRDLPRLSRPLCSLRTRWGWARWPPTAAPPAAPVAPAARLGCVHAAAGRSPERPPPSAARWWPSACGSRTAFSTFCSEQRAECKQDETLPGSPGKRHWRRTLISCVNRNVTLQLLLCYQLKSDREIRCKIIQVSV